MSIANQHEAFIERNGGVEVFRWIIEQDGVPNYNDIKLYPIIAWNEYHHDDVIVIGSAYRYKEYFVAITYEEDYRYFPERLQVWIEDVMDLNEYSNVVELFRDNHLIAIFDENMEMLVEWYGEEIGIENMISLASYKNNILFEEELIMEEEIIKDDHEVTPETLKRVSNIIHDFIQTYNSTFDEFDKPHLNPQSSPNRLEDFLNNNEIINNFPKYDPYKFFKDESTNVKSESKDFDEDFKEKWA
jgi:hypothetical protein